MTLKEGAVDEVDASEVERFPQHGKPQRTTARMGNRYAGQMSSRMI
jgi:hypothetical protein